MNRHQADRSPARARSKTRARAVASPVARAPSTPASSPRGDTSIRGGPSGVIVSRRARTAPSRTSAPWPPMPPPSTISSGSSSATTPARAWVTWSASCATARAAVAAVLLVVHAGGAEDDVGDLTAGPGGELVHDAAEPVDQRGRLTGAGGDVLPYRDLAAEFGERGADPLAADVQSDHPAGVGPDLV